MQLPKGYEDLIVLILKIIYDIKHFYSLLHYFFAEIISEFLSEKCRPQQIKDTEFVNGSFNFSIVLLVACVFVELFL